MLEPARWLVTCRHRLSPARHDQESCTLYLYPITRAFVPCIGVLAPCIQPSILCQCLPSDSYLFARPTDHQLPSQFHRTSSADNAPSRKASNEKSVDRLTHKSRSYFSSGSTLASQLQRQSAIQAFFVDTANVHFTHTIPAHHKHELRSISHRPSHLGDRPSGRRPLYWLCLRPDAVSSHQTAGGTPHSLLSPLWARVGRSAPATGQPSAHR